MTSTPDRPPPGSDDDTIPDLTARLAAREAESKRLTARLKARNERVEELEAALAASQHAIQEIRHSTSWRITAPLRMLSTGARRLFRRMPARDRPTGPRRPTVAACLIAKDEGRYLAEWLAYYSLLGFDEILVYNNASSDNTAAIVKRASANDPRIRHIPWPDIPGRAPQVPAYNNALRRTRADWIAFVDADEFIVLKEHDSIHDFLAGFDEDTGAVCINWLLFGSSGHENYVDDLVIRRFTRCAAPDYILNGIVKSIVRPSAARHMHAHAPVLTRGRYCLSDGRATGLHRFAKADAIAHHPAQINHYVVKSNEEYRAKIARGVAGKPPDAPDRTVKFTDEFWLTRDRNEAVDHSIAPMIPKVEREMRRLMANPAHDAGSEELHLRDA